MTRSSGTASKPTSRVSPAPPFSDVGRSADGIFERPVERQRERSSRAFAARIDMMSSDLGWITLTGDKRRANSSPAAKVRAATLIVGPLSFAGLAAPHIARLSGLRSPLVHIYGAALIGGTIMILADWIGRNIAFPWQIPAGIVATLLGSIYFLISSVRR